MGRIRRSLPAEVRFARKLRPGENGCLIWTGAVGSHGYGNFWTGERYVLAHRYAYELAHGPIDGGKRGPVVMQTCDVRLCCAEEHLELGTHATNHADCRAKGRGPQYRRRLSPEQEAEVLAAVHAGASQDATAERFGIHQTTVSFIVRGRPSRAGQTRPRPRSRAGRS